MRGPGNEIKDLKSIVNLFQTWHLTHNPKLEYYYFLERVRKMGPEQKMQAQMSKLRNDYKGVEILEEFKIFDQVDELDNAMPGNGIPDALAPLPDAAQPPSTFELPDAPMQPFGLLPHQPVAVQETAQINSTDFTDEQNAKIE